MARGGARPGAGRPARKSANTSTVSRRARTHAREDAGNQRPWPADKVERWAIDRLIPYAKKRSDPHGCPGRRDSREHQGVGLDEPGAGGRGRRADCGRLRRAGAGLARLVGAGCREPVCRDKDRELRTLVGRQAETGLLLRPGAAGGRDDGRSSGRRQAADAHASAAWSGSTGA
jgi:hypothetical protein